MDEIREKFHPILDLMEKHVTDPDKMLDLVEKLCEIELTIREYVKRGENNN